MSLNAVTFLLAQKKTLCSGCQPDVSNFSFFIFFILEELQGESVYNSGLMFQIHFSFTSSDYLA